jgi:hypothetical protein
MSLGVEKARDISLFQVATGWGVGGDMHFGRRTCLSIGVMMVSQTHKVAIVRLTHIRVNSSWNGRESCRFPLSLILQLSYCKTDRFVFRAITGGCRNRPNIECS